MCRGFTEYGEEPVTPNIDSYALLTSVFCASVNLAAFWLPTKPENILASLCLEKSLIHLSTVLSSTSWVNAMSLILMPRLRAKIHYAF